jgi:hypothetical protein
VAALVREENLTADFADESFLIRAIREIRG